MPRTWCRALCRTLAWARESYKLDFLTMSSLEAPEATTDTPRPTGGTFASFRSPGYPTLWFCGLFSFLSVQMQMLLRGLLAWDLTEREAALGITYLCFGIAMLISTPLGGVASDRLPKRRIMLVSQSVITAAAAGMGAVVIADMAQFWMLLVAAVSQGAAFGFLGPARIAISRELVGREHLGNAITLALLSMNGTRVFAPAAAGVLAGVPTVGIGGTYLISAVFALISWVLMLRIPKSVGQPVRASDPTQSTRWVNPFGEIINGIRYVMEDKRLKRLVIASFFVVVFGFNYVAFLPALIEGEFGLGEQWVGYISSASAIGAVAVAMPLASRADSKQARPIMTASGFAFGVGIIGFGFAPTFWLAFGVILVVGGAFTVYQSLSNTLALAMADDEHQGRVQSLMMLAFAGFGIAAAPMGALAEWIGLRYSLAATGVVVLVASLSYSILERRSDPSNPAS